MDAAGQHPRIAVAAIAVIVVMLAGATFGNSGLLMVAPLAFTSALLVRPHRSTPPAAGELPLHVRRFVEGLMEAARPPSAETAVTLSLAGIARLDETYGAGATDHALRMLRRVLEQETRDPDLVARIGEAEFTVVLANATPQEVEATIDAIRESFAATMHDAGYECFLDVALGEVEAEASTIGSLLSGRDAVRFLRKEHALPQAYLN